MVTDPIADMLTRIRNAAQARHRRVDMPVSKLKIEIARLLKENHYIHDYKILDDGKHGVLRLYLKYYQEKPVIRELKRVSKPGLRRYVGVEEIPRSGTGWGWRSSRRQGRDDGSRRPSNRVGGELLALVW
jgi:small subunit ribosomal protein S8